MNIDTHISIIFLLGLFLLSGFFISRVFQKIGIPQVVGYVLLGFILGSSFFNVITDDFLSKFAPITEIALGFIGFLVGGELKKTVFIQYGKNYFTILLFEGIFAMIAVAAISWILTHNLILSILLGALASATAPAATVDVIWEYRARGILSSTILAIVALDDGLALILYAFAFSISSSILGVSSESSMQLYKILLSPLIQIGASVAIGILGGFIIDRLLNFIKLPEQKIIILLGIILLVSGISIYLNLSLIMSTMVMGATLSNWKGERHENLFDLLKYLTPPIYLFFFLFAGARIKIDALSYTGLTGIAYILFRFLGKYSGSFIAGRITKSPEVVPKYLGLALFSQAGVAIGLSIDIYNKFQNMGPVAQKTGEMLMNIIAATTLVVQLIGPSFVKLALKKAGEIPEEIKVKKDISA